MNGTLTLARAEITRIWRNKRFLFFTVGFPVMLYLIFGRQKSVTSYGVGFAAYYMVGMAAFGAFSGALNNNAIRIAQERKDGWIRQLRLTSLPANAYVTAKVIASMATTVPSVVIVLLLGRFYGDIQLALWKWIVIAVAIWFGTLIFAALAVAIGYRFMPDSVQPIALFVYFLMSIVGGLWFPLGGFLQTIGKALPTYQVRQIGTDVIGKGTVSATSVATILIWLALFIALAVWAVRSTAETV
jgi:ABC-2 type transport system permease protein